MLNTNHKMTSLKMLSCFTHAIFIKTIRQYNSQIIKSLIVGTVGLDNDKITKLLFKFIVKLNMMDVISVTLSID